MKVDKLASELAKNINEFIGATDEIVEETIKEVADKATEITRSSGDYRDLSGNYRKSIRTNKVKKNKEHQFMTTIYSKDPHYRITHLLEFGHATKNGGRTKAYPHFAKGEQYAEDELVATIKRKIGG